MLSVSVNMTKILTLIAIYLFTITDASNNSFVFTPKMAQSCKEHMCTNGYIYDTVYRVDSEEMREIKRDSEMAFEMHIAIQAMSNGHILLSSVPRPEATDRVYEFVVGGGGNSFTELRGHLKRDAKASTKSEGILSTFELRGFYIKISQDGLIEFGKEGEILPLLSYNDVSPLEIKYFSFAAWSGVEAKFLYDCPVPLANGSEIIANSQEMDKPISVADQLKRDLLKYKLPWLSPTPTMDVGIAIIITSVKYNAFQSKLETAASVVVSWIDDSLAWFPAKYNGTKRLKFRQGQIWSPKFYVFNSDDQQMFEGRNSELITIEPNGEAKFHFQTKVNTWCIDSASGLNKWPHDEYDCTVLIQPWDIHDKISIIYYNMEVSDKRMKIFSDIDPVIKNEWESVIKQVLVIEPSTWKQVYDTDNDTIQQSDRLFINIQVKRSAKPYNIVFYTPLLVLMTFVLLSFWSEPLTMNRVWFLAGCSIVICMGLCYVDYLVPCHSLPSILVLYTVVLGGVLTALLMQVLLMTKTMDKVCSSSIMQRIFTFRIFRLIFCLPAFKMPVNGNYILQEDEEPVAERGADVEEMEREKENTYCDKKELADVIDRVLFVSYSVCFAALLAAHF